MVVSIPAVHLPRNAGVGIRKQLRLVCLTLLLVITFSCFQLAQGAAATRTPAARIFRGGAAPNGEGMGPMDLFVQTIKEARRHLAAAGVARCISIFAMYPVDTIKTRMQTEQANPLRPTGLYLGVGGSLFGQVPYG